MSETMWEEDWTKLRADELIIVKGALGDVWGPMPSELIAEEAWWGHCLHRAHDLVAFRRASVDGRRMVETPQAAPGEARPARCCEAADAQPLPSE